MTYTQAIELTSEVKRKVREHVILCVYGVHFGEDFHRKQVRAAERFFRKLNPTAVNYYHSYMEKTLRGSGIEV